MILQLVAFTYCKLVTVMMVSMAVLYANLSSCVALPLVIFVAPMIALHMVCRCCDEV